jgi:hypothetical protein
VQRSVDRAAGVLLGKEVIWHYTAAPYGVKVRFTTTQAGLQRLCKRLRLDVPTDVVGWCAQADGELVVAVLDGSRATLVHECGHAAMFVLQHVGINPTDSNGEAYCYLLDHMFARFEKRLSPASSPSP